MEYAQILLHNLSTWPEYVQLVGTLHKVNPRDAHNTIKEVAIEIEQSKRLCKWERRDERQPSPRKEERATQNRHSRDVSGERERRSEERIPHSTRNTDTL